MLLQKCRQNVMIWIVITSVVGDENVDLTYNLKVKTNMTCDCGELDIDRA